MFPGSDLDPKILFNASSKTSLDLRHQGLQEFVNLLRESGMCAANELGDRVVHFCSNTMIHLLFEYMAYAQQLYLGYTEYRMNEFFLTMMKPKTGQIIHFKITTTMNIFARMKMGVST